MLEIILILHIRGNWTTKDSSASPYFSPLLRIICIIIIRIITIIIIIIVVIAMAVIIFVTAYISTGVRVCRPQSQMIWLCYCVENLCHCFHNSLPRKDAMHVLARNRASWALSYVPTIAKKIAYFVDVWMTASIQSYIIYVCIYQRWTELPSRPGAQFSLEFLHGSFQYGKMLSISEK